MRGDEMDDTMDDAAAATSDPSILPQAQGGAGSGSEGATASGPRTRWAAILWGVVLGAIAIGALRVLLSPGGTEAFVDWLVGLTPLTVVAYAILAVGGLLLVAGLAGLARRAQRRLAASRSSS